MQHRWDVTPRRGWVGGALLAVLLLVVANAVCGGVWLVVNSMGMPSGWLDRLPVGTWTLPGVALVLTDGRQRRCARFRTAA